MEVFKNSLPEVGRTMVLIHFSSPVLKLVANDMSEKNEDLVASSLAFQDFDLDGSW